MVTKPNVFRTVFGDRTIAYHGFAARIMENVAGGVWLCQMLYWDARKAEVDPGWDGWFYKSQKEIRQETFLSDRECRESKGHAVELGIVETEKHGSPPTSYYRFNFDKLQECIDRTNHDVQIDSYGVDKSNGTGSTNQTVQGRQIKRYTSPSEFGGRVPKSTSENTQENTPLVPESKSIQEENPTDNHEVVYGRKGKKTKCSACGSWFVYDYRLNQTPCCGKKLIWSSFPPETEAAKYLRDRYGGRWDEFDSLSQKREWERSEREYNSVFMCKLIDVAFDRRVRVFWVVDKILSWANENPPPPESGQEAMSRQASPDPVSEMNMQAILANAARRQKEKVEGKD